VEIDTARLPPIFYFMRSLMIMTGWILVIALVHGGIYALPVTYSVKEHCDNAAASIMQQASKYPGWNNPTYDFGKITAYCVEMER
jgi:hypothetical protein